MSRNNEERFVAPEVDIPKNEILTPASQTVMVPLPTKGLFYNEDHPWYKKENVEIKYMTIFHQDILVNETYIRAGVALEKLIESLLVDKVDIKSIFAADFDALVLAARIEGYGDDYNFSFICPKCLTKNETTTSLNNILENSLFDENKKSEKYILTEKGFKTTLPLSKKVVEVVFLTPKQKEEIDFLVEKNKKHNLPVSSTFLLTKTMLVSVEGEKSVEEFVKKMKPRDVSYLQNVYALAAPQVVRDVKVSCKKCDHKFTSQINFSAELFWPDD